MAFYKAVIRLQEELAFRYYTNIQSLPAGSITDWHFVVGVYDDANNTTKLYIDGEKKASSSSANFGDIKASGNSLRIGMYGGSHSFNGKIDEVRLYSRPLSASEIEKLYEVGNGVYYYHFDGLGSVVTLIVSCVLRIAYFCVTLDALRNTHHERQDSPAGDSIEKQVFTITVPGTIIHTLKIWGHHT